MSTLVKFKLSISKKDEIKLVTRIQEILEQQHLSKVKPEIFPDTWGIQCNYIVRLGYFDRGALKEIMSLQGIEDLIDIKIDNNFSTLDEILYELARLTDKIPRFQLDIHSSYDHKFQELLFLESFQKFIKDGIIDKLAKISFYVELRAKQYRIGKYFI